ncbi:MAG: GNAT family protein [Hyphomicrobiaceae bacterium]
MAFLRSVGQETGPVLESRRLVLRTPISGDYVPWAELRALSRDRLVPWEPAWSRDELTRSAFRRRLRHYQRDLRDETGYAFFVFRREDQRLVGGLSLSNIRRGVTLAVTLGYWMGLPFHNRGYMSEAVDTVLPFVFGTLWLHRIEAACLPSNQSSIRVLEKCGFEREGLARRYLRINGVWQDHYLYAALAEDLRR